MFSYTGLGVEEVEECGKRFLFMLSTGRVSMAGVNDGNVERVAQVIKEAIQVVRDREGKGGGGGGLGG